MKIIQINAVNTYASSTGRTTVEMHNYLNNNGIESYIAFSVGEKNIKNYKIGNTLDRKIHAALSRVTGLQGYFSKSATSKLLNYIDEIDPDIVHLRNLHANYINLEMLFTYLIENDIATVITLHDCWFYTGKCTHYTMDNCDKWEQECSSCIRLKKDIPSFLLDRTTKMFNDKKSLLTKIPRLAVIGVSDWITDEARRSFLVDSSIVKRIYNWIDLDIFKLRENFLVKKKFKIKDKFIILGVSSSWSELKGLGKFIELSKLLSEDMVILLVGKIDNGYDIPSNIITIDEVHEVKELANLYTLSDVFINFSLEESFGKVTAEAMACGTPVIVQNSTASPELIREGTGYILPNCNNNIELLELIKKIKKNGKDSYSKDCIKFARNSFNKIDRINDYIALYKELIRLKEC